MISNSNWEHLLTQSFTQPFTHPRTHTPSQLLTHSITHSVTRSLFHSPTTRFSHSLYFQDNFNPHIGFKVGYRILVLRNNTTSLSYFNLYFLRPEIVLAFTVLHLSQRRHIPIGRHSESLLRANKVHGFCPPFI